MSEDKFEKLAEEYKLTQLQKAFAEYYVYVTGLDGPAAVELAGYKLDKDFEGYDERTAEVFKRKAISSRARELLDNPKVTKYINALRTNLENHLIVDKLWVIKNLKDLAMTGTETTRIRALELLGKNLEMFTDRQKIEDVGNPGEIAQKAFESRMNILKLNQKQENE